MPRIGLNDTWSLIPKGSHVFQIVKAEYKEDFGKLEITMKTAQGQRHVERYSLIGKNKKPNEGALNAFSYFARAALNDFERQDADPEELVGRFIRCTVEHDEVPGRDNPERTYRFVKLAEKEPADGFEGPQEIAGSSQEEASGGGKKPQFDLDSLLS